MPATSQAKHPTGKTITFTESGHTYIDSDGQHYLSGTSAVKRFFPPFDAEKIAAEMAIKKGTDKATILAEWKEAGNFGTRCHETAEALLLDRQPPHTPRDEKERKTFSTVWDAVKKLRAQWQVLAVEQIVFSPRYGIAGTIDLVMRDNATGIIWILDWKTNKAIRREGFDNAMALGPVAHMPDCNFSQYSLQLALYERIMRDEKYLTGKINRMLIHVGTDHCDFMPTPDLRPEVGEMLLAIVTDLPF